MRDSLWDGRKIRLLNVIDDCSREVLWIETDTSLPAKRVIRVLEALKEMRGLPKMIRVDNGPEFISHELDHWCKANEITLVFIQPGKPTQNAFIERCNGTHNFKLRHHPSVSTAITFEKKTLPSGVVFDRLIV